MLNDVLFRALISKQYRKGCWERLLGIRVATRKFSNRFMYADKFLLTSNTGKYTSRIE